MIAMNLKYTVLLLILYGIMYIAVPAICLYPVVRDQDMKFRILFYQISGLTYVSLVSYVLAYTKLYSFVANWIAFFIIPIGIRAFLDRKRLKQFFLNLKSNFIQRRTLQEGRKMRYRRWRKKIGGYLGSFFRTYIRPNLLNILSLLMILLITSVNLGYFHLHYYTYACSDEPTHIYWVSCLLNGNAFPAGLYPHGMHFIVGQLCSMFGLNVTRAWLSFGIVSVTVVMISAYLVVWKVFSFRIAGLVGIVIFLCSGIFPANTWYERLEMVMPMEMAMYAFFVMVYGLVCWIRDQKLSSLFMTGMGILGTAEIHVFVTIFAFFTVVAFLIVYHQVMARKKCIHKLLICGVAAIAVAILPYIVGMMIGYHLEQSFSWGMSVVSVSTDEDSGESDRSEGTAVSSANDLPLVGYDKIEEPDPEDKSITDQLKEADSFKDYVDVAGNVLTKYYTETAWGGFLIVGCSLLLIIYGGVCIIIFRKDPEKSEHYLGYIFFSVSWMIEMIVLYLGYIFGAFSLMVPTRSTEFISFLTILILGAPLQIILELIGRFKIKTRLVDGILTFATIAAVSVLSILGYGRNYKQLNYGFTMEDSDLKSEQYLVEHNEAETWTFISTTNARMAVVYHGYHYEITDLLRCVRDLDELYIPTQDIYIAVEKRVPSTGSKKVDGSDSFESSTPVSAELASTLLSDVMPVVNGQVDSEVYLTNYNRQVIMSHLYYWMEKIKQVYPNEVTVFTEDDYCTVYHISQDPYFLLNLVVDYSDLIEADLQADGSSVAVQGE